MSAVTDCPVCGERVDALEAFDRESCPACEAALSEIFAASQQQEAA